MLALFGAKTYLTNLSHCATPPENVSTPIQCQIELASARIFLAVHGRPLRRVSGAWVSARFNGMNPRESAGRNAKAASQTVDFKVVFLAKSLHAHNRIIQSNKLLFFFHFWAASMLPRYCWFSQARRAEWARPGLAWLVLWNSNLGETKKTDRRQVSR